MVDYYGVIDIYIYREIYNSGGNCVLVFIVLARQETFIEFSKHLFKLGILGKKNLKKSFNLHRCSCIHDYNFISSYCFIICLFEEL